MSVFYPSNQQRLVLEQAQAVLDINDYWKSGDGKTFPTQYSALSAVNEKARQILDNFVSQAPPSSDIVRQSLQNLTSSYNHCFSLLAMMNDNKIETYAQQFYSVEFIVTGLNPDRDNQLETIRSNVDSFESEMRKTAQFKTAFENIVKLSNWPTYRDVAVETTIAGEFTVQKRSAYHAVEIITVSSLILLGVVCLVYKVVRAYFPSIPVEPT